MSIGGLSGFGQMLTTQDQTGSSVGSQLGTQAGNQANQQMPIFTGQQMALQGQAGDLFNQILAGNTAQFGLPPSVWQAANMNFNSQTAPQLAAQYGSGSPAIGSAQQQLTLQLAAQGAQMQQSNALNAFNAAAGYAFNPIAMNSASQNAQSSNQSNAQSQQQTTNYTDLGGLLGGVAGALGNGLGSVANMFP